MLRLDSSVSEIPNTGKALHSALKAVGISQVRDLLFYFPRRHIDFSLFKTIRQIREGETVTIRARVMTIAARFSARSHISLCEAVVSDGTGSLKITWFNQSYIAKILKPGAEVFFAGKVDRYKTLQLSNPIYEPVSDDSTHTGKIVPVYKLTAKLYNKTLRTVIKSVLPLTRQLVDVLPAHVRSRYGIAGFSDAVQTLHFPENKDTLDKASFRLAFEDIFIQQLAVQTHQRILAHSPAPNVKPNIDLVKAFLTTLPFNLTVGQKKSLWQILQDMETKHPMNRLLEGDVGSGKTLVAFLAAFVAISRGYQVALLAPTEILAKQHYDSLVKYLQGFDDSLTTALLTHHHHIFNNQTVPQKDIVTHIKKGSASFIIGTHALFQEHISFKNIGLVIIDEQHRFGVEQRSYLIKQWQSKKTKRAKHLSPHLLSLSATPIPRTLALSLYGDLSISTLTEVPKGRQTILTRVCGEFERGQAYTAIRAELKKGHQVFIVTPRVEEDDESPLKAVKAEYEKVRAEIFPDYPVGLVYGTMKGADKERAMGDFNARKTMLLVATSVIEIGIDVPNATIMLIEGAERFGLAQLHQLRGRVGRGSTQSYCILMTTSDDPDTLTRLQTFATTHDGFKLAAIDLAERGFGNLFGTEQTGLNVKFPQYMTLKTLGLAHSAAKEVLGEDPGLTNYPLLKEKVAPLMADIHLE